jgi:hypothetical protein
MPTARTAISTRRHFLSHLRSPRGRGGWLFENEAREVVFQFSGTYGEAKKAAVAWGTERGIAVLHVCP